MTNKEAYNTLIYKTESWLSKNFEFEKLLESALDDLRTQFLVQFSEEQWEDSDLKSTFISAINRLGFGFNKIEESKQFKIYISKDEN